MTTLEFDRLVRQYQGIVYTVCHQLVPDVGEAQDLTQETFLAAWRSIDRCPPGFEKQWLALSLIHIYSISLRAFCEHETNFSWQIQQYDKRDRRLPVPRGLFVVQLFHFFGQLFYRRGQRPGERFFLSLIHILIAAEQRRKALSADAGGHAPFLAMRQRRAKPFCFP